MYNKNNRLSAYTYWRRLSLNAGAIFIVTLSFFVLHAGVCICAPVTSDEALILAEKFFMGKSPRHANAPSASGQKPALQIAVSSNEMFIVNDTLMRRFVIIGGDDRLPSVLGYSDSGIYDATSAPCGMRSWIASCSRQIAAMKGGAEAGMQHQTLVVGAPIEPLLECHFSQDEPFNRKCPTWGADRCPTGCVPTAIAQIMFHHRWPERTTKVIPGYTTRSNKIDIDEIPVTDINWGNILADYNGHNVVGIDENGNGYSYYETEYTEEQADAVAMLMLMCGTSVRVDYRVGGSSASLGAAVRVLRDYFGYDEAVRLYRENYDDTHWLSMLYGELSEGVPVLYDGDGTPAGHAFIIDGYDDKGLFHINWGWGGMCDGYFTLESLDPMPGYSFNGDQSAIVGLRPSKPGNIQPYAALEDGTMTFYYDAESGNRPGLVFKNIRSCASDSAVTACVFDPSFAAYKIGSMKEFFSKSSRLEKVTGMGNINTEGVTSLWELFYYCEALRDIDLEGFRTDDVTDMGYMFSHCTSVPCLDLSDFNTAKVTRTEGMFQDCDALNTIFVGDGWTMEHVSESFWMFVNDFALEGCLGSRYNYPNYEAGFAHVDGGSSNPGYLSDKVARYKIVYYVDGEEYAVVPLYKGAEITPLAEPVREGCVFSGWSEIPATMPSYDVVVRGTFIPDAITDAVRGSSLVTVFSVTGKCVYKGQPGERMCKNIPKGLYVVNGRKVLIH